jgi:U3 small nucleolar RNA-associated protein 13
MYLAGGQHLVSAAGNAVLKVWSVRTGEALSSLEFHSDKVWALARPNATDEESAKEFISGGGDSQLAVWRDYSKELADLEVQKREEMLVYEQELRSSLFKKEYLRAALRALELNRPYQLRGVLRIMVDKHREGQDLPTFLDKLSPAKLLTLWELAVEWNMHARNSALTQTLLQELLKRVIPLTSQEKVNTVLEPLVAYSERHFNRVDNLLKESYLLDHLVACMDNGLAPVQHE